MKGKIIAVDYAKTNNLNQKSTDDSFYVKKSYGYVCYEKGMGSAGGDDTPTWKPKKSESQRLIGKPGEIKETFNQKGERFLTKIGKNGYATKERHYSYHSDNGKHSNPHDHEIDWSNNYPDFGSPINYDKDIPEFKQYGGSIMHNENIITFSPFEDADDFKLSLIRGKEIEFHYNGINYGVFYDKNIKKAFYICKAGSEKKESYFETIDELLNYMVQEQPLRDIVTRVEVLHRNI